jgi:hypothetical protein
MTLQNKILLINAGLATAVVTAAAFATDTFPGNGFFLMLAFITVAGGLGSLALGLLLLLRKDKRPAKGYLITSALLILISLSSYFFLQQY